MKTVFMSLIALFMTLPAMARTVDFAGGKFEKKISERQTTFELKFNSNLKITLTDTKASTLVNSVNKGSKLNSEGGWQPEFNDLTGNTAAVLEVIRTFAAQNCSAATIAEGIGGFLGQELSGKTIDISSLPEDVKICLSK